MSATKTEAPPRSVRVARKDLLAALRTVGYINPGPRWRWHNGIGIECCEDGLHVIACDGDGASCTVRVDGEPTTPGADWQWVGERQKLVRILRSMPGSGCVGLSMGDAEVTERPVLRCVFGLNSTVELRARLRDADEFPFVTPEPQGRSVAFTPEVAQAISRVMAVASQDQTRLHLCTVHVESVENDTYVVATDTYRLAVEALDPLPDQFEATLPTSTLKGIGLWGRDVEHLLLGERIVGLPSEGVERWASSDDSKGFPDWRQLPTNRDEHEWVIRLHVPDVIHALTPITQLSLRNYPVRIEPGEVGGLFARISANDLDSASIELPVSKVLHGDIESMPPIGFNPDFLLDAFKHARAAGVDEVTMGVIKPHRPVLLTAPGFQHLVMPIRLDV